METNIFEQLEATVSVVQVEEAKKISDALLEHTLGIQFNMIAFDQN